MKVHIEFDFGSVQGGGNSFLSRLKREFDSLGNTAYAKDADVILYNSHHNIKNVKLLMKEFRSKKFVHRVDGPMRLYNSRDDKRDDKVRLANDGSSGTIFQTEWSKKQNKSMYPELRYSVSAVIQNGCDSVSRTKLFNKGFSFYQYLDENLDFDVYDFLFIGNSPVKFKNITMCGVKQYTEVSDILKKADLFITASKNDPCSNSLIEALATGLPCVARNSGGHPEILKGGGCMFIGVNDMVKSIEGVYQNRAYYEAGINVLNMNDVANRYLSFFRSLS